MVISLKENDREVVSAFLNKHGVEVFSPSINILSLIVGDKGSRLIMPLHEGDCYLFNGIVCMSVLEVVKELGVS